MYICTHIHTYTHIHTHIHTHTYTVKTHVHNHTDAQRAYPGSLLIAEATQVAPDGNGWVARAQGYNSSPAFVFFLSFLCLRALRQSYSGPRRQWVRDTCARDVQFVL